MNSEHTIPALDKALSILEHLGRNPGGSSQAELCSSLEISASTCYRILQTLQLHDFVRKQPGGRFDISGGLLTASMRLFDKAKLFENAQPTLEALSAKTGLSSKLSIRQGFEQISILRAESPLAVSVSGKVGARFPVIEGSVGAALLCSEDEETVEELIRSCKDDIEERRMMNLLPGRIEQIKRTGIALNERENRWNVEAMSAPVYDSASGQSVAALTLIGFKTEFKDLDTLASALVSASKVVSTII